LKKKGEEQRRENGNRKKKAFEKLRKLRKEEVKKSRS